MKFIPLRKNTKGGRGLLAAGVAAAIVLAGANAARATEGDATQWALGVQTAVPALLPPPGRTAYFNYTVFYQASALNNSKGRSAVPGFDLNVFAEAGRLVHTWNTSIDGVNLSSGVILAGNYIGAHAPGISGYTTGLSYAYFTPLYFTYAAGPVHLLVGPSVFVPIGHFGAHNFVNPTNNYYSFNNETAITYLPTPRLEMSAENALTINGTNGVTHYHSGADDDTDFAIDYNVFPSIPGLQFGFQGFYARQFQDDTVNGVKVGDGNRLEEMAVGPQVIYYFGPGKGILAKWQHEIIAHNAPQGDRFWVEFVLPL